MLSKLSSVCLQKEKKAPTPATTPCVPSSARVDASSLRCVLPLLLSVYGGPRWLGIVASDELEADNGRAPGLRRASSTSIVHRRASA